MADIDRRISYQGSQAECIPQIGQPYEQICTLRLKSSHEIIVKVVQVANSYWSLASSILERDNSSTSKNPIELGSSKDILEKEEG